VVSRINQRIGNISYVTGAAENCGGKIGRLSGMNKLEEPDRIPTASATGFRFNLLQQL